MTNGANHTGVIHLGDLDQWTFTAAQNDRIHLSIGEVFPTVVDPVFVPWIRLVGPTGVEIGHNWGALAALITVSAPLSGTYTVVVATNDGGNDNTGNYRLTLAKAPGVFSVPADDEGGAMTNGANHTGVIHLGDLDQWTFTAAQNDRIHLSIGEVFPTEVDPGFVPWIRLVGPTGVEIGNDWGALAAQFEVLAPLSGTYTVVVTTNDGGNDATGNYQLTVAKVPGGFIVPGGDEGGGMSNGVAHPGVIHLGDLDQWTFTAKQGAAITLTITEVQVGEVDPGFVPWIRLVRPDGTAITSNWADTSAQINVASAPVSGTYRVVVSTNDGGNDATGSYLLTVTGASPGFTDDPLAETLTVIKAVHFTELRTRIDALRTRFGLSPFSWTDASLPGVTVKKVHLDELRAALVAAYVAAARTPPAFTDGTITAQDTIVRAVHILQLRDAVLSLE
jgi:hypothetical protein